MSNRKIVHMQQSGPIAGITGWYSGGQTYTVDYDTLQVVDQIPMQQQAYDASPLVEPEQEQAPQEEMAVEPQQETEEPFQPSTVEELPHEESPIEPAQEVSQEVASFPEEETHSAQEASQEPIQEVQPSLDESMPEVVPVPNLPENFNNEGTI